MREHAAPCGTFTFPSLVGLGGAAMLVVALGGVQVIGSINPGGWALLLGLLVISSANYFITRDVLYPAFMFSAVWCFAALVYVFFPFEIDPIGWSTVCIFLGGNLCFSVGCTVGNRPLSKRPAWFTAQTDNPQPRRLLLVYTILAVPLSIYATMKLAGVLNLSTAMFVAARQAVIETQADGRVVNSNVFVSMAPTIAVSNAFALIMEEGNRWVVAVGIGTTVVLGLFTTGRGIWLLLFLGWLMLALVRKRDRSVKVMAKQLVATALIILVSLTLATLLTKKETQKESLDGKSGLEIAGRLTACYIAGPIAAFNYVVQHPSEFKNESNNTFALILAPLSRVGLVRYKPLPAFDTFYPVPFQINAFTAFKPYYVDFGVTGCFVAFLIFGFISGSVFHAALRETELLSSVLHISSLRCLILHLVTRTTLCIDIFTCACMHWFTSSCCSEYQNLNWGSVGCHDQVMSMHSANEYCVSVCMATYNGARYIHEQIASILPQLGDADELIVVDDSSADQTVAIVEGFCDARIRVLRNVSNCGVVATFERAIQEARGEIVFLSDQDDVWRPDKIAVCRAYFDSHPDVGVVLTDADIIDGAGTVIGTTWMGDGRFRDGIVANLIRNRYLGCVMSFRRNLLSACLPFPPDLPMHDIWIGMVNRLRGRAALIPKVLMSYRRHGKNVTTGKHAAFRQMLVWRWTLVRSLMRVLIRQGFQRGQFTGKHALEGQKCIAPNAMSNSEERVMAETRSAPKRAVVFAPFFSIDGSADRPRFVGSMLAEIMPVDVVTSDFDHSRKTKREHRNCEPFEQVVYLKTRPYDSNVSAARLISHLLFAFKAAAYFKRNRDRYDVVYATAPLNVLTWMIFELAGARTKVIDVVDIWPDVLPFPPLVRRALAPVFAVWKWFFKSAVFKSDFVMGVSDTFVDEAATYANDTAKVRRFYLGHGRLNSQVKKQTVFTIAYVGNLGRLYDFETLLDVLSEDELRENVRLFVVGTGDRQDWLIAELKRRRIQHRFFGVVFEPDRLADILRSCHVGFNGYINTTASFSYKASTYFAAGLPMINSMTGDLNNLVAEHGLGKNYKAGDRNQLKDCVLRLYRSDRTTMNSNCERFFATQVETDKVAADMRDFLVSDLCRSRAASSPVILCVKGGGE